MIVPDKNRDPCSIHCWRATALRRRIAPFSHDILLSSSHRRCQRELERFSIPPGVKSAHIWRLSSATRSSYDTAVTKALEIIDEEDFLPDAIDVRVRIRVEFVSVENCSDGK